MSDTVQIATAIIGFLGTVFAGVMAYLMARLKQDQAVAAVKVEQVKQTLEARGASTDQALDHLKTSMADQAIVGRATLTLVNHKEALHLQRVMDLTEQVAKSGDPGAVLAAQVAKRDYETHMAQQALVDAQPGTVAQKQGKGPTDAPR